MLFSSGLLFEQFVLLSSIGLAIGLGVAYLRWRNRLSSLRAISVPLFFFMLFGICDALVTLQGTWQAPWREGNPAMRAFLVWGGWWGQCVGSVLWILAWTLVLDGLELLRRRSHPRWATLVGWIRLWTVYALAIGHLNGLVSWMASPGVVATLFRGFYHAWSVKAGWLSALSPFGYPLYSGLFFGGLCAAVHWVIVGVCARNSLICRVR